MTKTILYVLGAVITLVGLYGFVGGDLIFGIFAVDLLHNLIHIVTGVALLAAAYLGGSTSSMIVKVFAVIYALVAIGGFVSSGDTFFGVFANNLADDLLHVVIAALLVWIGFFAKEESSMAGDTMSSMSGADMGSGPSMGNPGQ
jgi:hypothetical protein